MASHNNNCPGNRETQRLQPHAPITLGDRGAKLLVDVQRSALATSKPKTGRLLPEGEDNKDLTIKCLENQLAQLAQILVDNNLMRPPGAYEA